jgi:hypothetical protein
MVEFTVIAHFQGNDYYFLLLLMFPLQMWNQTVMGLIRASVRYLFLFKSVLWEGISLDLDIAHVQ